VDPLKEAMRGSTFTDYNMMDAGSYWLHTQPKIIYSDASEKPGRPMQEDYDEK
jgi:hypothetical protein